MADAAISKARAAISTPKSAPASPHSILGAETHFEGNLTSKGDVRLEGAFAGNITTTGHVIVGEAAKLEGDLIGESVTVRGIVTGNVIARRISITGTGRILGDLRQEKLLTEDGGFMQGMVTFEKVLDIEAAIAKEETPPSDVVEAALEEVKEETELEKIAAGKR